MVVVHAESFGQLGDVEVEFGDLTILVGAQATGKTILLQTLKLGLDGLAVRRTLRENFLEVRTWSGFLDLYYGDGMRSLWRETSKVQVGGAAVSDALLRRRTGIDGASHTVTYVPAQRTLALPDGSPLRFRELGDSSPFVVRQFSAKLHDAMLNRQFDKDGRLFPNTGRLTARLRTALDESVFHGAELMISNELPRQDLRLTVESASFPMMTWTAGQREVIPLLLALYPLLKAGKLSKDPGIDWVIIEEPEMGLHPSAIMAIMSLVIELVGRGYKVAISTHHPLVLDVAWAIGVLQGSHGRQPARALQKTLGVTEARAEAALDKVVRVHALEYTDDGQVGATEISQLDPASELPIEREWGGLTGFSGDLSELVVEHAG